MYCVYKLRVKINRLEKDIIHYYVPDKEDRQKIQQKSQFINSKLLQCYRRRFYGVFGRLAKDIKIDQKTTLIFLFPRKETGRRSERKANSGSLNHSSATDSDISYVLGKQAEGKSKWFRKKAIARNSRSQERK